MMKLMLTLFSAVCISLSLKQKHKRNKYDIIIVGGGFSGLYTAYRLGQSNPQLKIAIVEKKKSDNNWENSGYSRNGITEISTDDNNACLGGLIQDYPFKCNNNPDCPSSGDFPGIAWVGGHAMRYHTAQGSFFLARELGFQSISIDPDDMYDSSEGSMGHNRGIYFIDNQNLLGRKYSDDYNFGNLITRNSGDLYDTAYDIDNVNALCNQDIDKFLSFSQYFINTTGSSNGLEFIRATNGGFNSCFGPNDAIGTLELLDQSFKAESGYAVYPNGGMSIFIRELYKRIIDNNYADIYCNFDVNDISYTNTDGYEMYKEYTVTSSNDRKLNGNKIIITARINDIKQINGIIDDISSSIFAHADIWNPIKTLTCTQQFTSQWYKDLIPKQFLQQSVWNDNGKIAIDTWSSSDNCIQRMENFNGDIIRSGNILRSLYIDGGKCFNEWRGIIRGSNYDYNGIVANSIKIKQSEYFGIDINDIPNAVISRCDISNNGWQALSTGASHKIGNKPYMLIEKWSQKPLPNDNIHLCGEMWSPRAAWIDGARSSCDLMLNSELNVDTKYLKQWDFTLSARAECTSQCTNQITNNCEIPDRAIM